MINQCPEDWFLTCKNSNLKCTNCGAANNSSKPVLYKPTHSGVCEGRKVSNHPTTLVQQQLVNKNKPIKDQVKSKQVKQGFKQEKVLADSFNETIKQSLQSGALLGDGDLHALEGLVKVDSKLRIKKQSFSVTWTEYEKGISQDINAWAITINKNQKDHTCVFMTQELFCQLIGMAKSGL